MKKIVYDLDGTLIRFNTFKCWVVISFVISIFFLRVFFLFSFFKFVYQRKIKLLNRVTFKAAILELQVKSSFWKVIGSLYGKLLAVFFLRKDLLQKDPSAARCLATAAPDIYVIPFSKKINIFDYVIYSHFSTSDVFVETLNVEKKRRVLIDFSEFPDVFYTDHYDDIPLAKVCKFTYLVSPSKLTIEHFGEEVKSEFYSIVK